MRNKKYILKVLDKMEKDRRAPGAGRAKRTDVQYYTEGLPDNYRIQYAPGAQRPNQFSLFKLTGPHWKRTTKTFAGVKRELGMENLTREQIIDSFVEEPRVESEIYNPGEPEPPGTPPVDPVDDSVVAAFTANKKLRAQQRLQRELRMSENPGPKSLAKDQSLSSTDSLQFTTREQHRKNIGVGSSTESSPVQEVMSPPPPRIPALVRAQSQIQKSSSSEIEITGTNSPENTRKSKRGKALMALSDIPPFETESILEGKLNCPKCHQGVAFLSDVGHCNAIRCGNKSHKGFYHFCAYCKREVGNGEGCTRAGCPVKIDKEAREKYVSDKFQAGSSGQGPFV